MASCQGIFRWLVQAGNCGGGDCLQVPAVGSKKTNRSDQDIASVQLCYELFSTYIWHGLVWRPNIVFTIEPPLFCAPAAWIAARLAGAKAWLHVQDFEVDAAFELGYCAPESYVLRVGY